MKIALFSFFLSLPILLTAQRETDFTKDKKFFDEKSIEYDKWLKSSDLGKVLHVQMVRVTSDRLSLELTFNKTKNDSILPFWNALKRDFERSDRGTTLEEELFFKMVYFMEIEPNQGYIQILDTYNPIQTVCFKRRMKYENNKVNVYSEEHPCRSETFDFTIEPKDLSKLRAVPKGQLNSLMNKEAVFKRIKNYAIQHFVEVKPPKCENRKPNIEWITENNNELYFRVTDLCKEILVDETNPWWCRILEPTCTTCNNCIKREMLEIHINYTPLSSGYKIHVSIDAKFGSGWYNEVKRGAYKNMELDYKKQVEEYALKFKDELLKQLKL